MLKYQFVVGVSLAALEEELNRTVSDDPCLQLKQILYVQGTGFVAVMERPDNAGPFRTEADEHEKETQRSPRKSQKKS